MTLTTEQIQLVRLLCDVAVFDEGSPEDEQVAALLDSVELFLFSQQ